jgi:hypothetical protein
VRRWEDNIKINLKYYVKIWNGFIWLDVGSTIMNRELP